MKPAGEIKRQLVRQWLAKAEEDFALAERLFSENTPFLNAIGLHSQQAAEKFLKALLVQHQLEFTKTHDLDKLLDSVAIIDRNLAESLRDTAILSIYGVEIRYPGDLPDITPGNAKAALLLAAKVRKFILELINHD